MVKDINRKVFMGVTIQYKAVVLIISTLVLKLIKEDYFKLFHWSTNKGWFASKGVFLMFWLWSSGA